jgi:hypothetical protein
MEIKKIILAILLLFVVSSVQSQTSVTKFLVAKQKVTSLNYHLSEVKTIADSVIDLDSGDVFIKTLSKNTSFTFANKTDTYSWVTVIITNTASNYLAVFPGVKWPGNVAPVMTTGVKLDIFSFFNYAGTIYGSYQQNYTP